MGVGSVMAHTPTIRKVAVLVLFSLVQFFWFTATFTYSESRTVRSDVERSLRVTVPAVPEVADVPAVRDLPKSTATIPSSVSNSAFDIARSTLELANPGKSKSAKSGFDGDLGAQIKYCIVFPLLNSVGPPIPTFDVPVCPSATSTPPGSSRLTVVKVVINDDSGTATTTDFTLLVDSTTIVSGATLVLSPGSYVVSEATTTVTVGTTTLAYVQEFDGDCDTSGNVTLGSDEQKMCTVINDDAGPGGQGGEGNGGDGDGGGGDGGGDGNGGGG